MTPLRPIAGAVAACLCAAGLALAAPTLEVPEVPPGAPGGAVPPNVLIALSLTYRDAAAAYTAPYDTATTYDGYFNPRLCYSYPAASGKPGGAGGDADLSPERGYFSAHGRADARHMCGAGFSGNFLNWAATSRLDLLRLGLTGGDRWIDTAGMTVLQRAVLPDGPPGVDFYAHPEYFARKTVADGTGLAPFGAGELHIVSCRDRILFSRTDRGKRCDAPRRGKTGRLLVSDKHLGEYAARVRVCDADDAADRPALCRPRGSASKPEGALQEIAPAARIGVMSYLTGRGVEDRNLYGGVLRAPLKDIRTEWNEQTGVLARDPDNTGAAASGAINVINRTGRDGIYKAYAPTAELYYEALRYLQGRALDASAGSDGQLAVLGPQPDPLLARCQRNAVAVVARPFGVEDRYLPGNWVTSYLDRGRAADTFAPGEPFNVMAWTDRAGLDAGVVNLARKAGGADGTGSFYLAGAALWSSTRPIRADLDGTVETLALQTSPESGLNPLALAARGAWFDGANAAGLREAALAVARRAVRPQGSVPAMATASVDSRGGFILLSSYDRASWSGDLARFELVDGRIAPGASWRAAGKLPPPSTRNIFTTIERPDGTGAAVPFEPGVVDMDPDLVRYLRGERRDEGKSMRARAGMLGDIVRSVPLVVGPPSVSVQGEGYAEFRQRHAGRRTLAYVGANDGMLHAFDAATGIERFAYVPRALYPALPQLASPGYAHRAWVDGSPGAGEAYTGDAWRTVLASGYGMGAKGLFAIDITRPEAFAAGAGELWQFSDADDRRMGHVLAPPVIAKLKVSSGKAPPRYRYFALVSSGLNNYANGGAPDGALFLLALDKPRRERWRINVNYYRFDAAAAERGDANALGPPSVVLAADGSVTHAYAGDLQGRLWRFDLRGSPPWRGAATQLFTARDGRGTLQPISSAPRIVYGPGGGHLVLFGTGRMLEARDALPSGSGIQSLYAVYDSLAEGAAVGSRSQLAVRMLERSGAGFRVAGEPVDYARHKGWYFDFPDSARTGERMTAPPLADGGVLVATSTVPAADPCSTSATRTYVLSALGGLAHAGADAGAATAGVTGTTSANSSPIPPLLVLAGTTTTARDGAGLARAVRRYAFVPVAPGGQALPAVSVALPAKRLSWREITNWQELHDAAIEEGESK
ncbi:pilus assembly protein [Pseudoduganella sp. GCM10020061]|uniref:pilus assembly protein n=1 Tax=Pseudoduganella sp. GCM10020061 TaxID=3317345 RepID=UPI003642A58F